MLSRSATLLALCLALTRKAQGSEPLPSAGGAGGCRAALLSLAGRDDAEVAAVCRSSPYPELCRWGRSALGERPWSSDRVDHVCSTWHRRALQASDRDGSVNCDTAVAEKDARRASLAA